MVQYRKTVADIWWEHPEPLTSDPWWRRFILGVWSEAVVLRIEAEPLREAVTRSWNEAGSFPLAIPPWPVTCVEVDYRDRARAAVIAFLVPDAELPKGMARFPGVKPGGVFMSLFYEDEGSKRVNGPAMNLAYCPDEHGDIDVPGGVTVSLGSELADRLGDALRADMKATAQRDLAYALVAFGMCHAKNVERAEVRPPRPLSLRHAERHGRPLVRYYTLDIEPMRKLLRTGGRMDEVGLKRALHLCRGHFKDYREGGGLFGRHKGLYWWDANVRGSVESGIVAKDYRVVPPSPSGDAASSEPATSQPASDALVGEDRVAPRHTKSDSLDGA